jgi:D-lactate dehydrogenase (cytochrome)
VPIALEPVTLETSGAVVGRYLADAAHYPGGRARAVARPSRLEEVAWTVRHAASVLPVGAQSSLTGGATPADDVILSTERLTRLEVRNDTVVAGAGVTLYALQSALAAHGRWFPPVPTFLGATVGGVVATNAAGAATFKYGTVRRWVRGLTVVLASGEVLRLERGQFAASADETFVVVTGGKERVVRIPEIRMPDVPKCSAGYFSTRGMDLIDLFIGSEGTLGVVVEAELSVRPRPAGVCWILAAMPSEASGVAIVRALRESRTLDVSAIEHIDRRCIEILREDGVDRRLNIDVARNADLLILVQIEVDGTDTEEGMSDATVQELQALLDDHDAIGPGDVALPSDHRRAAALIELREAVPSGVNRRVALAHAVDSRVHKTAADVIVPFERLGEIMAHCRALCEERRLDLAVWGHISDGNVHPNVIPRDFADVERGREVILELARRVVSLGGSPLAEHGVGRHPVKQRLLEMLYGEAGIESMRQVKLSLDPTWKLSPGLLFEEVNPCDAG